MRFFIDTANVEDIPKANDMGIICGVNTNPSLIAKEGIATNVTLVFSANQALLAVEQEQILPQCLIRCRSR